MTTRRAFIGRGAALAAGALLPHPAAAQLATIHELSGEVLLDGRPVTANSALRVGQTLTTGRDGRISFTVSGSAYFLRPGSELHLHTSDPPDALIDVLRLVRGGLGATFSRLARRQVIAGTAMIVSRGAGLYVETTPQETYACNCFGAIEIQSRATGRVMESLLVTADKHQARRIEALRLAPAPFERHTNAEMARLEQFAGRPNPF